MTMPNTTWGSQPMPSTTWSGDNFDTGFDSAQFDMDAFDETSISTNWGSQTMPTTAYNSI